MAEKGPKAPADQVQPGGVPATAEGALSALRHAVLACTADGRVTWLSPLATGLSLAGQPLAPGAELWGPDSRPVSRTPHRRTLAGADGERVLWLAPLGEHAWLVEIAAPDRAEASQAALRRRLDFERAIVAVSAMLMRAEGESLGPCIEASLGAIGQFFAVDRAYLFRIDQHDQSMSNTHEWVAAGISREAANLQQVPLGTFPWLMAELQADRAVIVPEVSRLPAAAIAERTEFEREGIRSIVLVPIPSGACLWGFAGFDAVRGQIEWTEDFELGLRLVGKMLAGALQAHELALRLTEMAFHDALTGLANRKLLEDRLQQAHGRARRGGGALALLLVDLDDFKAINDRGGHRLGDLLLCEVARRLCGVVRSVDTVARLGGDEFVLLLDGADETEARGVATRVLHMLGAPFDLQGESLRIAASVGVAHSLAGSEEPDELLRAADAAMYRAKANGKNRWAEAR